MHAIFSSFSRKVVVNVGASSQSQLTKMVKKQPNQSRHLLPSRLSSPSSVPHFVPSAVPRSAKVHGFFASKLGNTNLKLKFGNVMESRAGFFSSELPSHGFESGGFTGFQKRGWYGIVSFRLSFCDFAGFQSKVRSFPKKSSEISEFLFSMILCFSLAK